MFYKERLEKNSFVVGRELLRSNEIPSVLVFGETLPEAWETAVLAAWEYGAHIPTEYDQKLDPESRDVTMMLVVTSPFQEPRIHKSIPCGYDFLEEYTQEVVDGIRDFYVGLGKQSYSYHDRLKNWPGIDGWERIEAMVGQGVDLPHVDQIEAAIDNLALVPHSRRAQATTWNPLNDATHHEPPCLQRVWCRVVKTEEGIYLLEMNTHWRSRDALKAAFLNMYALTELQKKMAENISAISGQNVKVGRYVDINDSWHIYGSYVREAKMGRFLNQVGNLDFEQRTARTDDSSVQFMFKYGREKLAKERDKNA